MQARDKVKVKQEKFVLNPCLQRARQCLDYLAAPSPLRRRQKSNVLLCTGTKEAILKIPPVLLLWLNIPLGTIN